MGVRGLPQSTSCVSESSMAPVCKKKIYLETQPWVGYGELKNQSSTFQLVIGSVQKEMSHFISSQPIKKANSLQQLLTWHA